MNQNREYISDAFEKLYIELQQSKQHILSNEDKLNSDSQADQDKFIKELFEQYKSFIFSFSQKLQSVTTQYYTGVVEDMRYLLTIFIDETFIGFKWFGKDHWTQNLLEHDLFKTHQSGDKFYEKLDALLVSYDATQGEIAKIYLTMLSLGFQGKYRGSENIEKIEEYRSKLCHLLGISTDISSAKKEILLKEHVSSVIKQKNILGYRYRSFFSFLAVFVLLYLALSGLYWENRVSTLNNYAQSTRALDQLKGITITNMEGN